MEHKTSLAVAFAGALFMSGFSLSAHAQLDSLLHNLGHQAEQHAAQKIANKMTGRSESAGKPTRQNASPMLRINSQSNFVPGPVTLYQDSFATTPVGAMPHDWGTNGSAQIVSLQGIPGRWMQLQHTSHYKLRHTHSLPHHFTVQFDVLAVAHKITDLDGFSFGFAQDNSLRGCLCLDGQDGIINMVDLSYNGIVEVSSSATGYDRTDNSLDFAGYANRVMHVAIAVNGNRMQVYLNRKKIADSRLFENDPSRYFYLREGNNHYHGAQLLISNFRIGGFKQLATRTNLDNQ